ncbi:RNA polymerase sigma factor [Clostridium sp. UBA4548]|uniref:RNA polymerase sigma factor n=1 Tax=Clostridium sp. UBA4548 TaxID=1946361 RepID=UPI0025B92A69|nr:RNA polymerase sigma factor [Clostridium sp. UBA4548]
MITDELLVARVLKGERDAFDILIRKYQGIIYNYIFKNTLNKEDTEDIIQEVFIKAYKNLYRLENKERFYSWLFKIAINTMNTSFKAKKQHNLMEESELMDIKCNVNDTPEERLQIKEENLELLKRLSVLNEEEKNAMILKYVQGFSYKEVGEILGIKEETIKTKLHRAKKKLHDLNRKSINKERVLNEVQY